MTEEERKLREEKAKLTKDQRSILDKAGEEKRAVTSDEVISIEQMDTRKGELRGLIAEAEKLTKLEAQIDADEADESRSASLIPGPDLSKDENRLQENDDSELRAAFTRYCQTGLGDEYRALQQDIATQAGYLVAPEKFVASVIQDINNLVFMRQKSKKHVLKKAASMGVPKRTARTSTFAMGAEIGEPTADTSLAFGKRQFIPRPASGDILVSKTLLRSGAISVDAYVRSELAYEAGIFQEQLFFTGTGAGEPLGIFTASDDGISTSRDISTDNTTTSMTTDGLKNAKFSMVKGHRNGAEWMFHRDGIKQIDKLKDGMGRYIWTDGIKKGEADVLLGLPVSESEYVPNTFTTGLYVGIIGNFRNYWIVDSLAWELQVLMELYAKTNQVDFLVRFEFDGQPVLEEAFARVTLG